MRGGAPRHHHLCGAGRAERGGDSRPHAWQRRLARLLFAVRRRGSDPRADRIAPRAWRMAALARSIERTLCIAVWRSSPMGGNARGPGSIFMSRWVAHVHRLSGIALAIFLPIHFWALGNALQLDSFLAWTERPLVKAGEWAIVVALAAH